jgi:hypothetical protein
LTFVFRSSILRLHSKQNKHSKCSKQSKLSKREGAIY